MMVFVIFFMAKSPNFYFLDLFSKLHNILLYVVLSYKQSIICQLNFMLILLIFFEKTVG